MVFSNQSCSALALAVKKTT